MRKTIFFILLLFNTSITFAQRSTAEIVKQFDALNDKVFPVFELEDDKGTNFNTASLKGKTLYIDFWFTQCAPCLQEVPYAKALRTFFASDTNIVFVNICIENIERKVNWKETITQKEIGGINLFYAKNRPQKVNLIREYKVEDFPTYMIVNADFVIIGHNAPRPSDKGLVQWSIVQAMKNVKVSDSYKQFMKKSLEVKAYLTNSNLMDSLYSQKSVLN